MLYAKYTVHFPTWSQQDISISSLKARKEAMQKFYDRAYDAMCYASDAGEDESLSDADYAAISAAYSRLHRIQSWVDDGITALDEAIEAYEKLEDSLRFALEEVPEVVAKGGRK